MSAQVSFFVQAGSPYNYVAANVHDRIYRVQNHGPEIVAVNVGMVSHFINPGRSLDVQVSGMLEIATQNIVGQGFATGVFELLA